MSVEGQKQQVAEQSFELNSHGQLIETVKRGAAAAQEELTPLQRYMLEQQTIIARDVLTADQQVIFDRGQARVEACHDPDVKKQVTA